MTPELEIVKQCVEDIESKYFSEEITVLDGHTIVGTGKFRENESTYVYQLLKRIEAKFKTELSHVTSDYQVNAPKQLIFKDERTVQTYSKTFNKLFDPSKDDFFRIPDIVIHSGPHDYDPKNQILISEVKTDASLGQKAFDIDFFKLNVYHQELKFQNSFFIIVNRESNVIKKYLTKYRQNGFYISRKPGLAILVKSEHGESIKILTP
jgi:hypothetical protein